MRVTNNEEQITMINGLLNREAERIPSLSENLYNVSIKRDIKETKDLLEKVSFKEIHESKIPQFYRAPNN